MEQLDAIATSSGDQSIRASNALSRMTDAVPDLGRDDDPVVYPFGSPIETHWTRILHYDLFTGRDDSTADPGDFSTKGPGPASEFMPRSSYGEDRARVPAADRSIGGERSEGIRSSIVAAAILFAVCVAMYLDTSGVADVVSANAAAAARESWTPTVSSRSASNRGVDASQLPPANSLDKHSEPIDNSRACRLGTIVSNCIYD